MRKWSNQKYRTSRLMPSRHFNFAQIHHFMKIADSNRLKNFLKQDIAPYNYYDGLPCEDDLLNSGDNGMRL